MSEIKISLIGAGSGCFSLGLIKDLCLTQNLKGSTVSFMDIDEERLNAVYELCRRYSNEIGTEIHIEKTLDRQESLNGADFVINTALAAGHHRLQAGWELAKKHGLKFAGSYHIMYDEAFWVNFYQLKLFESIVKDMLAICPDAWHLMIANPVLAGITYLARKYSDSKTVGLCHGYCGVYNVAKILGLEKEHITYQIPGVNHFVWLTDFYYKGENAFAILDRWIERDAEQYWKTEKNPDRSALSPKAVDLYRKHGVLPIGDTSHWSGAAWPWWYNCDDEIEKKWMESPEEGWNNYFKHVSAAADKIKQVANDKTVKVSEMFPGRSDEPMLSIVESIACDIPRIMVANIRNSGNFVPGVPLDFEVEIPCLVSKSGVQGITTNGLPKAITAHILRDRVAPTEMELEAYQSGRREHLIELILMDKWCSSRDQAEAFLADILSLPFHKEMRRHYH